MTIAYRALADDLRAQLLQSRFGGGQRLPTEAELSATYGVSRQTVRRAFHELVAEGLVYRVPGSGTYPMPLDGRYLRQLGSIEDLMAFSTDSELELVEPLRTMVDARAGAALELTTSRVMSLSFRRLNDGVPFCSTRVWLPVSVGKRLSGVSELLTAGMRSLATVIGLLDDRLANPIATAQQSITVAEVSTDAGRDLDLTPGERVLQVERLYRDARGVPVEFATAYFRPDRYCYRVQLSRSTG